MRRPDSRILRKTGLIALTAALLAFPGVAFAQGITGSAHDFSGAGWNPTGEICVVCHTPHFADTSVVDAPLWNHAITAETFTPYTSATLDATVGQPAGISKLCLSCHDGVTAIDSFGGTTGSTTIDPTGEIGVNLTDDHPISFTYDAALAALDGGLYDPTVATTDLGGTINNDLLFSDNLECASCHDVHDDAGITHLLRIANTASNLCLTCHNK